MPEEYRNEATINLLIKAIQQRLHPLLKATNVNPLNKDQHHSKKNSKGNNRKQNSGNTKDKSKSEEL